MTEEQGGGGFEERLRAARSRQGLDPRPKAKRPDAFEASAWSIGLRVGVELVSAFAVAAAIGWALDHFLHTAPLFIILFVLLGGAAGVLNVYRMFAPRTPPKGK
jgi:ATP synthase protein I